MRVRVPITDDDVSEFVTALSLIDKPGGCSLREIFHLLHPGKSTRSEKGTNSFEYNRVLHVAEKAIRQGIVSGAKGRDPELGIQSRRYTLVQPLVPDATPSSAPAPVPLKLIESKPAKRTRQFECMACPNIYISAPAKDDPYEAYCPSCHTAYFIKGNMAWPLKNPIRIEIWQKAADA